MNKRRLLLVAQRPSDFTEMIRVGRELHKRGHSIFFLYHCLTPDLRFDNAVLDEIEQCRRDGIIEKEYYSYTTGNILTQRPVVTYDVIKGKTRRRRFGVVSDILYYWLKDIRLPNFITEFLSMVFTIWLARKAYQAYCDLFGDLKISAVILPEDVVGYVTPFIIKAGHKFGIPSVILPYTISNQQEAFAGTSEIESFQAKKWLNRLCAVIFPKWCMQSKGKDIVRLPSGYIICHEMYQVAPPDPWMLNSGFANLVAVESEAMLDYYIAGGLPKSKLRVVGAVYDDILAAHQINIENNIADIRMQLDIENEKPFLLIGGCPNQLAGKIPYCDFSTMEEIVDYISDEIRPLLQNYEILVRPHPNYPELGTMFEKHGYTSTSIDTAQLVACADVYIAFASATIRWAIACAVPTINYDVFHYGYDDFAGVKGVANVFEKIEFHNVLKTIEADNGGLRQMKDNILQSSKLWSMMDGKSVDRIESLINEVCDTLPIPRTSN